MKDILEIAMRAALRAGREILAVYRAGDFDVRLKADRSPLTAADEKAQQAIAETLRPAGLPILSEEGRSIPFEERRRWTRFWLVDPLDGTKEFIRKNGEFTVNIALIESGRPVLGVVYAPALGEIFWGGEGLGSRKAKGLEAADAERPVDEILGRGSELPARKNGRTYTVVASRSHLTLETRDYIQTVVEERGEVEFLSRGSSLKICMVAEGAADVYPRFAPTMEWDTAAGHAVADAAGFAVTERDGRTPLEYNKEDLQNPWFIVKAKEP